MYRKQLLACYIFIVRTLHSCAGEHGTDFGVGERMERSVLCSWMAPVLVTWQEGARLTPEDMERVQSLLCTLQPKMRYRALVVDLSKICSEEMTPDALVAYEF